MQCSKRKMLKKKCSQNTRTKPAYLWQSLSSSACLEVTARAPFAKRQAGRCAAGRRKLSKRVPGERLVALVPCASFTLPALGRGHGPLLTTGLCLHPGCQAGQGQGDLPASGDSGTRVHFALLHILLLLLELGVGGDRNCISEGNASGCPGDPPALGSSREEPPKEQTTIIILITNPHTQALYNLLFPQEACNAFAREPFISK